LRGLHADWQISALCDHDQLVALGVSRRHCFALTTATGIKKPAIHMAGFQLLKPD
jgi:hypothetical protein